MNVREYGAPLADMTGSAVKIRAAERMNGLAAAGIPFIFIIDFLCRKPLVIPVAEIDPESVMFDFNGYSNSPVHEPFTAPLLTDIRPVSFERYRSAFDIVQAHLRRGNSYLVNLTFPTAIEPAVPLKTIFLSSRAKYRLWVGDEFTVFSPETFVTIVDGVISSCPMKGTIDASIPDAESKIMSDEKEIAEHLTIVDLIRNDLNMIAREVKVETYRYVDTVRTNRKTLLQISSKISGRLPPDYRRRFGELLFRLLPAGSVTGAPKKKTVEIIAEAERYDRGYYTGICGYFDGNRCDSGVMIRFIERTDCGYFYKSGGGITLDSDPDSEYAEMTDKVYVPTD